MIKRESYIAPIRGFYDSDLIKIITGVRRSGKSVLMEQIIEEIRERSSNIIYLDFEDRIATESIETWKDLVEYIDNNKDEGTCYVFLDEIQVIENWALACKTLRRHSCSLFITGSNSKLLSGEFTTELSGRYVSFRIRPFIYRELVSYAAELGKDISVMDYMIWGGFPKRLEFNTIEEQKRYFSDLNETIIINDIAKRYRIKKVSEFRKFASFILVSNSRIFSAKSIADYMCSHGVKCSSNTIQKWVGYLSEAYIIDQIPRYSRKAKAELEQSKKTYDCDVALNTIRCKGKTFDISHNLENIVYNELIYRKYDVSVYDNNGKEIDFLAVKGQRQYYIQVALSVAEEKAFDREMKAFSGIEQIHQKILITNDEIDYSTSAVKHIKLKDFLIMDDFA